MKVDITKFWIEGILKDYEPQFESKGGLDLDGNGRIDGSEKFGDLDWDGRIGNQRDYEIYLFCNREGLARKIPFFRWGRELKVTNRIHQLLYWESDLFQKGEVGDAYHFLSLLSHKLKKKIFMKEKTGDVMTPVEILKNIYGYVLQLGIRLEDQPDDSFVASFVRGGFDCNPLTYASIAVIDEVGVPHVRTASLPQHTLIRSEEPGNTFYFEFGQIRSVEYYYQNWGAHKKAMDAGYYFYSHSQKQWWAEILGNRALTLEQQGRKEEANAAYEQAIQYNSNDPVLYNNFANFLFLHFEDIPKALTMAEEAIQRDTELIHSKKIRANALLSLQRYEEALMAYNELVERDPNNATLWGNRGIAQYHNRGVEEAIHDFKKAVSLDPHDAQAHYNLAILFLEANSYQSAFQHAILAHRYAPKQPSIETLLQELKKYLHPTAKN